MTHNTLPPYPKVYALGHNDIAGILDSPVVVQEKFDGSQITFGLDGAGQLMVRSKSVQLDLDAPQKQFAKAVAYLKDVADRMLPGLVYRGECITSPKHNVLPYTRTPIGYVMVYDVQDSGEYIDHLRWPGRLKAEAKRLGLEHAEPLLVGQLTKGRFDELLQRTSMLGGALIEGVVIKNYTTMAKYGGPSFGKYVSEAFKETHRKEWSGRDMTRKDVVTQLIEEHATPARWDKAVQHLRDAGRLTDSPADIGPLMAEVNRDVEEECADYIKQKLYDHFRKDILRAVSKGLPQWYKDRLAARAWDTSNPADVAAYDGAAPSED